MSALPLVSGRGVVAALVKLGYEKDRQKGSHIVLRQAIEPFGDQGYFAGTMQRLSLVIHKREHRGIIKNSPLGVVIKRIQRNVFVSRG